MSEADDVESDLGRLRKRIDVLKTENDILREANNKTYCAYCNAQYQRTDDALAKIREHISVCEFHPMRKLEAEIEYLKAHPVCPGCQVELQITDSEWYCTTDGCQLEADGIEVKDNDEGQNE
jgi:hypothetical protein